MTLDAFSCQLCHVSCLINLTLTWRRVHTRLLTALTAVCVSTRTWPRRCYLCLLSLRPSDSVSPFLTCAHAVISSSLSLPSLYLSPLLLFLPPSDRSWQLPSGLFQALAHAHALPRAACFALSLSVCQLLRLFSPPSCKRTCMQASVQVGWVSEAWALGGEDLEEDKSNRSSTTSSFSLPVHLVAHSGEGISHCVFLPRVSASLSTHLSFIYNEVSDIPVPAVAQTPCFFAQRVHMSSCPSLSLFFPPQFIHLSTCLFAGPPVTPFAK